jgi:hypothetical protein
VLFVGADRKNPPAIGIIDLDISVTDKLEEAHRWALAYPEHPVPL